MFTVGRQLFGSILGFGIPVFGVIAPLLIICSHQEDIYVGFLSIYKYRVPQLRRLFDIVVPMST